MARVVVEAEDVPAAELVRLVREALADRLDAMHDVSVDTRPPPRVAPGGKLPASAPPSSRFGQLQRAKMEARRWDAVTPYDIVAWWAARYRALFDEEDPSLQGPRAIPLHETAVRDALRRYHRERQQALLQYLTMTLKWWVICRARSDRRAPGFPRLRNVLSSDWLLGLYLSGDMKEEVDAQ